jgi:hypothetical protein
MQATVSALVESWGVAEFQEHLGLHVVTELWKITSTATEAD